MALYIEIGNSLIKVLNVLKTKKETKILSFKNIEKAMEKDNIPTIAEEILAVDQKTKASKIIANNNYVYYRDLKIPALDEKQTTDIIQNELVIGQNLGNMICDYIPLTKADDDGMRRVFGCALPEDIIVNYIDLFKAIKCKNPAGIDIAYAGLFEYLSAAKILDEDATMVVEVSKQLTRIFLFDGKTYILVRAIRINTEVEDVLKFTIKEEINKMSQFQTSRNKESKIGHIYFFGDYARIDKVVDDCKRAFGTNVEFLPMVEEIEVPSSFNYLENIYSLGSILGD